MFVSSYRPSPLGENGLGEMVMPEMHLARVGGDGLGQEQSVGAGAG